jgi:glycosyltransferase involved in cell wall biosynthesis
MRARLSVTILTKNEQDNISRCLESLRWADEILVADSGSTDGTLAICRGHDCRILQTEWLGYGATKQRAADAALHDWILSVDADEEVTEELARAIHRALESPEHDAYRIMRRSFYLGVPIRHGGWNRDYPIRLFDRRRCRWNDKPVHESLVVSGSKGTIRSPLLHHTYPTISSHVERMNLYAELAAEHLWAEGRTCSIPTAVVRGAAKFVKMYLLQAGFLDGRAGFVLSRNSAFGVYLKYLKLWERTRSASST